MTKRREKFDADRRAIFLDFLRKGIRRTQACKKTGISRGTFNRRMNADPKFVEEVAQAETDANELIEQSLFNTALKGNVTAQQVWLYNRDPDRWSDKRNLTVGGDQDNPLQIEAKVKLSIDDILVDYYGGCEPAKSDQGTHSESDGIRQPVHPPQTDTEASGIPDKS